MGVFRLNQYLSLSAGGCAWVVRLDKQPDDAVVSAIIQRYFGGAVEQTDNSMSAGEPQIEWKFTLPGTPDSTVHKQRWIEAFLDRDTHCDRRNEPFYFVVRNEKGDDDFTLAVAEGLAKLVTKEMNGNLEVINPT